MTIEAALNEFLGWGVAKYTTPTIKTYRGIINRFILFVGKDILMTDISITHLTNYNLDKLSKYNPSTVALHLRALRQFFKYAYARKYIDWDPALIPIPKYINKSHKAANFDKSRKMLENIFVMNFRDLRDKTLLSLLVASGLRVAEICDLKVSEIDMDKRFGVIHTKKNRVPRMIFWDDYAHQLLRTYLNERVLYSKCENLFIAYSKSSKGHKLTTRSVQRMVKKYRMEEGITPHSFRHGLGVRAVQSGIHPRFIQKILGHKNLNSSAIYMQVNDVEVVNSYKHILNMTSGIPVFNPNQ